MGSTADVVTFLRYGMVLAIGGDHLLDGEAVCRDPNENLYDYLERMNTWYTDGSLVNGFYKLSTDEDDSGNRISAQHYGSHSGIFLLWRPPVGEF